MAATTRVGIVANAQSSRTALLRFAAEVEAFGFDSLWVNENVHTGVPHMDPFITLGAAAVATTTIRLGTAMALLPLRHPVELARTIASLDVLSDGRLICGVAAGGGAPEGYAAYEVDVRERGSRSDEVLEVMLRLWKGEAVSWHGRHHSMHGYALGTLPLQRPRPPVWLGGLAEPVLRRVVRFGDGFMPIRRTPEQCRLLYERLGTWLVEAGREAGAVTKGVYVYICLAGSPEEARRTAKEVLESRYRYRVDFLQPGVTAALGGASDCAATLARFSAAGADHIVLDPACRPEEVAAQVDVIGREILPGVRSGPATE